MLTVEADHIRAVNQVMTGCSVTFTSQYVNELDVCGPLLAPAVEVD